MHTCLDLGFPIPAYYPKKIFRMKIKDLSVKIFMWALFITAKQWNNQNV